MVPSFVSYNYFSTLFSLMNFSSLLQQENGGLQNQNEQADDFVISSVIFFPLFLKRMCRAGDSFP